MKQFRRINQLAALPNRLHHYAYTTDDHEATRHFYEDIIGLPLVAMYIEREHLGGEWIELGHAFYGLGDGSALAFFNFADPAKQSEFRARPQSIFIHVSLSVGQSTQDEIAARLKEFRVQNVFTLDHGYCRSLYATDPNGLLLEFTVDPSDAEEISTRMFSTAHEDMKRWIAGGRTSNNRWRSVEETQAPTRLGADPRTPT